MEDKCGVRSFFAPALARFSRRQFRRGVAPRGEMSQVRARSVNRPYAVPGLPATPATSGTLSPSGGIVFFARR
jgi:hypothetical protein